MTHDELLARINALAKKDRETGLSTEEKAEQAGLRQKYLQDFRGGFKDQIEHIKVVDEKGVDLTPDKVKAIQKERGIHGRDKE